MVPRIHAGGRSFGGVVQYLTHDAAIPGDRHPKTGERVGGHLMENLPDCQPREAAAIMRGTARDAAVLKALAGVSAKGRPLAKPVYHYSLSWAPDEKPEPIEMVTAARSSLQALGMADRQAFIVEHTDRAHAHCHIVVNRVSPEDGRAASDSHSKRALSAWARTWERERGGIRCPGRPVPFGERAIVAVRRVFTEEPPPPPPPPQVRRGPGLDSRERQERQAWAALYARQRRAAVKTQVSGPRVKRSRHPQHRLERRDLAQQQLATREQARVRLHLSRRPRVEWEDSPHHWERVGREDEAAPPVERRLPHVGGVLAVSDQTFACLAHSHYTDAYLGRALASIHLDHLAKRDGFQRAQAESQYFVTDDAIAAEQRQQAATNASEYRAGSRHTPHAPSWKEAAAVVVSKIYARVCDVIEQLCREVREHGGSYEIDPTIAARTRNQFAKDMERIRAEREREEERERGRDPDFGPSR